MASGREFSLLLGGGPNARHPLDASEAIAERDFELRQVVAERTVAVGEPGDLLHDGLATGAHAVGHAEAIAERGERLLLVVADLSVELRDPARDRPHEQAIELRELGAVDRAELG